MSTDSNTAGILVCKDLFFTASVTATARSLGFPMKVCVGLSQLPAVLEASPSAKVVIVDMNLLPPEDPAPWAALRAAAPPIVLAGFGSHVDTRRFEAARTAGFDHALPNSAFSGRMVEWLKEWMG